jgi:two-component system response regulator AtoC
LIRECPTILVVEDEEHMSMLIEEVLSRKGYRILTVNNGQDALQAHQDHSIAITLLDIKLPGLSGLEVLEKIHALDHRAVVIMITAYGSIDIAVEAMRKGASDFLSKPFDLDRLEGVVAKALSTWELVSENRYLRQQLKVLTTPAQLVGNSKSIERVRQLTEKVANTDYSVLITGESGTGKSLLAKIIHEHSSRQRCPFINVNCAAIPSNLIESELFGHEKGAFTGAVQRKIGKFERANNGTIFLDEISCLDLTAQASLLHILQEQQYERVGGTRTLKADFRVIAASNQDLKQLVKQGKFREDLFFRLNAFPIAMPSLKDIKEDIIPMAQYLLQRLQPGRKLVIAPESAMLLKNYPWPGNVREMENVLKQTIVLLGDHEIILPCYLPYEIHSNANCITAHDNLAIEGDSLKEILNNLERQIIIKTLNQCNSKVDLAAERLKIPVRTLYYRLKKLEIGN